MFYKASSSIKKNPAINLTEEIKFTKDKEIKLTENEEIEKPVINLTEEIQNCFHDIESKNCVAAPQYLDYLINYYYMIIRAKKKFGINNEVFLEEFLNDTNLYIMLVSQLKGCDLTNNVFLKKIITVVEKEILKIFNVNFSKNIICHYNQISEESTKFDLNIEIIKKNETRNVNLLYNNIQQWAREDNATTQKYDEKIYDFFKKNQDEFFAKYYQKHIKKNKIPNIKIINLTEEIKNCFLNIDDLSDLKLKLHRFDIGYFNSLIDYYYIIKNTKKQNPELYNITIIEPLEQLLPRVYSHIIQISKLKKMDLTNNVFLKKVIKVVEEEILKICNPEITNCVTFGIEDYKHCDYFKYIKFIEENKEGKWCSFSGYYNMKIREESPEDNPEDAGHYISRKEHKDNIFKNLIKYNDDYTKGREIAKYMQKNQSIPPLSNNKVPKIFSSKDIAKIEKEQLEKLEQSIQKLSFKMKIIIIGLFCIGSSLILKDIYKANKIIKMPIK
jgi:Asp-tRNA(Asn)/Glu-tRNA(Gln) amidotransferase C subunit